MAFNLFSSLFQNLNDDQMAFYVSVIFATQAPIIFAA